MTEGGHVFVIRREDNITILNRALYVMLLLVNGHNVCTENTRSNSGLLEWISSLRQFMQMDAVIVLFLLEYS